MDNLFALFEIIGTLAFAVSGAMEGIRHRMDIFGVCVLGLITSTGGGVLRDLVIGQIPPRVFLNPRCALIALAVSILCFLLVRLWRKRTPARLLRVRDRAYFAADTLGLAAFTVLGIQSASAAAVATSGQAGTGLMLFVGVITGVGGGVLRDVLSGSVPSIFRKHVYALASIAGAAADILLGRLIPHEAAMVAGFVTVCVLRTLAAHFKWNLPKIED